MELEVIYPTPKRRSIVLDRIRFIYGYVFFAALIVCPVVNYILGGKAWSIIALWGMLMVWLGLKQPLVENNLISRGVTLLITTDIMLVLIDIFIAPGWARLVVPIFWFSSLAALGVLFFVFEARGRNNFVPLIITELISAAAAGVAMFVFKDYSWPVIVLGCLSAALFISSLFVLRTRIILEFKKKFHI